MAFLKPNVVFFTKEEALEYRILCNEDCMRACLEDDRHVEPCKYKCEEHSYDEADGYYSNLSASGYMDCTSWLGPYKTEAEALEAIKNEYEVDDNGDDL